MEKQAKELENLTNHLERLYAAWSSYQANGGQDPFWPDGVNMNLLRNHIIASKRRIHELVTAENAEPTLFPAVYPDIWHKPLPPEVQSTYMARADEIRTRAHEQLELYKADANFNYIREHIPDMFPGGKSTASDAAGIPFLPIMHLSHLEECIEKDDLVDLRRTFRTPYEEQAPAWAEWAAAIRAYLSQEPPAEELQTDSQNEALYLLDGSTYLHIQTCDDGYDYTLYDAKTCWEIDGGQFEEEELEGPPGMVTARAAILELQELTPTSIVEVPLDILDDIQQIEQEALQAASDAINGNMSSGEEGVALPLSEQLSDAGQRASEKRGTDAPSKVDQFSLF